jgi:hypothetical protein
MVTVWPASGERVGYNLIALLGTVAQSKLRQLSQGNPNSEENEGKEKE